MELIPYEQFGRLRMKQFTPAGTPVHETDGYEWMGGFWINEGIGFTSVSRHEDTPDEAGGLEVDFRDLPEGDVMAIFNTLHLHLRPGMTLDEIRSVLGEPEETVSFLEDRKGYYFTVGLHHPYCVGCIIRDTENLIYVCVIRKDVLSKCDA